MKVIVTVTLTAIYDMNEVAEYGIDTPQQCIEDVTGAIDRGDFSAEDFDYSIALES